jgi:hypothetical protein
MYIMMMMMMMMMIKYNIVLAERTTKMINNAHTTYTQTQKNKRQENRTK